MACDCIEKRDAEIHQDVRAELSMEADEDGHSVEISVRYGVVSLTGLVESYARKCAIDRAVGRIVGSRSCATISTCAHLMTPLPTTVRSSGRRTGRWAGTCGCPKGFTPK